MTRPVVDGVSQTPPPNDIHVHYHPPNYKYKSYAYIVRFTEGKFTVYM
jgi:hypothetical protein